MPNLTSLPNRSSLRLLAQNALQKNLYLSAALIVERLLARGNTITYNSSIFEASYVEDCILYARCFYMNGEPRRCLAILEQKQLLSAVLLSILADIVNPQVITTTTDLKYESKFMRSICLHLEAIQLAAQCLFLIDQHDDCVSLLEPLVYTENDDTSIVSRLKLIFFDERRVEINHMAAIYCLYGKCNDILDNRLRSLKALTTSILIDIACSEAAEYIVSNGMLSFAERRTLFATILKSSGSAESNADSNRQWILSFYEYLLLDQDPSTMEHQTTSSSSDPLSDESDSVAYEMSSAIWLVRQAEFNFNHQYVEDAYRLARHAYTIDPFDNRGLIIYIASMVELKLKTELFYLGHELVNSYPKMALSWYCVGCYYWCCNKQEFAQKYIVKATKMDKKFAKAWVMLGHVLSAQEESEQAISSYRTAIRLLPGDHRPMVYMAKELVRTHFLSLAQHILIGALELCPRDPGVLNELAVVYMKQDKLALAVEHFELAVSVLEQASESSFQGLQGSSGSGSSKERSGQSPRSTTSFSFKKSCGIEIYNNYATALRKSERFEEALLWYDKCLSANPRDASIFASKGFTLHLMQRLDAAINCYHQALALQPKLAFCSEMVNRAMEDMVHFSFSADHSFMSPTQWTQDGDYLLASAGVFCSEKAAETSYMGESVLAKSGITSRGGGGFAGDGEYEERVGNSSMELGAMGLFSPGSDESMSSSRLAGRLSEGSIYSEEG